MWSWAVCRAQNEFPGKMGVERKREGEREGEREKWGSMAGNYLTSSPTSPGSHEQLSAPNLQVFEASPTP